MDDGREFIYQGQLRCLRNLHIMSEGTAVRFLSYVINPKDFKGAYLEELYAGEILQEWDRFCRGEDVSKSIKALGREYIRVREEALGDGDDEELHSVRELADLSGKCYCGSTALPGRVAGVADLRGPKHSSTPKG